MSQYLYRRLINLQGHKIDITMKRLLSIVLITIIKNSEKINNDTKAFGGKQAA
jgi:hypothetical protein